MYSVSDSVLYALGRDAEMLFEKTGEFLEIGGAVGKVTVIYTCEGTTIEY